MRVRHFGSRPLIEDDSVRSDPTTLVNLRAGYRWKDLTLALDVLNLLDSEDHDIDYFYTSRLQGEPAEGIDDIHFHPVEPRTIRGYIRLQFRGLATSFYSEPLGAAGLMSARPKGDPVATVIRSPGGLPTRSWHSSFPSALAEA